MIIFIKSLIFFHHYIRFTNFLVLPSTYWTDFINNCVLLFRLLEILNYKIIMYASQLTYKSHIVLAPIIHFDISFFMRNITERINVTCRETNLNWTQSIMIESIKLCTFLIMYTYTISRFFTSFISYFGKFARVCVYVIQYSSDCYFYVVCFYLCVCMYDADTLSILFWISRSVASSVPMKVFIAEWVLDWFKYFW